MQDAGAVGKEHRNRMIVHVIRPWLFATGLALEVWLMRLFIKGVDA